MSGENMTFPNTALDFLELYSFNDKEQVYTNGSDLIPAFRVKQMIEHYFPKIVLCENCKHGEQDCDDDRYFWCHEIGNGGMNLGNHYCSYGEVKE